MNGNPTPGIRQLGRYLTPTEQPEDVVPTLYLLLQWLEHSPGIWETPVQSLSSPLPEEGIEPESPTSQLSTLTTGLEVVRW